MATNDTPAPAQVVQGFPTPIQQIHLYNSPFTFTATPSPFAHSIPSAGWNTKLFITRNCRLVFHVFTFFFSFASAVCLAVPPPNNGNVKGRSYLSHSEFRYSISVSIVASMYALYQLFKGISDIAFKGLVVPDRISDYISFIFDQVFAYLLLSSTIVSMLATMYFVKRANQVPAIVSTLMSFAAFLAIAVCSLSSGYKLCKRVVW